MVMKVTLHYDKKFDEWWTMHNDHYYCVTKVNGFWNVYRDGDLASAVGHPSNLKEARESIASGDYEGR